MDKTEKKENVVDDEPLVDKEVVELQPTGEATSFSGQGEIIKINVEPETELEDESMVKPPVEDEPAVDEPEPEPWPPFKNMPGPKKIERPTVRERIPQFTGKVLKLYKRMKRGEKLTVEQFAKRLKLTDPKDIQAAALAWNALYHEGEVEHPQFYKSPHQS